MSGSAVFDASRASPSLRFPREFKETYSFPSSQQGAAHVDNAEFPLPSCLPTDSLTPSAPSNPLNRQLRPGPAGFPGLPDSRALRYVSP
jgi:hypothetical protein